MRAMRRMGQKLSEEECEAILRLSSSGVLCLNGENGFPYGVPLSFVYMNEALYFHCAGEGYKLDLAKKDDKACFTVIGRDDVQPADLSTLYKSVIVTGRIRILSDEEEKRSALTGLCDKYASDFPQIVSEHMEKYLSGTTILKLEILEMSGKQAKGLTK